VADDFLGLEVNICRTGSVPRSGKDYVVSSIAGIVLTWCVEW
jgi:hypothetical protein